MTNLRWALAPFFAVVLGLGVACGGDSNDDVGDSNTTQSQTAAQTTAQSSSEAEAPAASGDSLNVASLAQNLEDVESFRFDMSMHMDFDVPTDAGSTGSQEDAAAAAMIMALLGNIEAEGAFVAPDSFQMEMTILGMNIEAIQIGDEAWTNDGSGWVADDGTGSSSIPFDMSSPSELPFQFIPGEELKGAETSEEEVNGFDTTRYHFDKDTLADLAESSGDTTALADLSEIDKMNLDVWITDEGIPVKLLMEITGESEGSDISINMEFNLSDFNDPGITIERPI